MPRKMQKKNVSKQRQPKPRLRRLLITPKRRDLKLKKPTANVLKPKPRLNKNVSKPRRPSV